MSTTTNTRPAIPHAPPPFSLPAPKWTSGKSLVDALHLRRTTRAIADAPVSAQVLSNVLFAACGVNRVHGPFGARGITAASASNSQEIDVYVLLREGAYRFDAPNHHLDPVLDADVRHFAYGPHQPSPSPDAPVQLVLVADVAKLEHTRGFDEPGLHDSEMQKAYSFVDAGIIAGNVYLFAASFGLACWFHHCDGATLARRLHLRAKQRALFAMTVGFAAHPDELVAP